MNTLKKSFLFLTVLLALFFSAIGTTPADAGLIMNDLKSRYGPWGDVQVIAANGYAYLMSSYGLRITPLEGGVTSYINLPNSGGHNNNMFVDENNLYIVNGSANWYSAEGNGCYNATVKCGLNISRDNGATWTTLNKGNSDLAGVANDVFVDVDDKTVYLATSKGVSILPDGAVTFTNKPSRALTTLVVADDGTIYAGKGDIPAYAVSYYDSDLNSSNSLYISTDGGTTFTETEITDGVDTYDAYYGGIYDLFLDSDGVLYIATNDGIWMTADGGASFVHKTTDDGLESNQVSAIFVDDDPIEGSGKVYASTPKGVSISFAAVDPADLNGLSFADSGDPDNPSGNKTTTDGLWDNNVFSTAAIGDNIYVVTQYGYATSTDKGATFTYDATRLTRCNSDPVTHQCATMTANGNISSYYVNDVFVDGADAYIATNNGISISHDTLETFTYINTKQGLLNNKVNALFVDGSNVYAATDGGLSISDDGGASFSTNVTTAEGLGSNYVNDVLVDGSNIYAATERGLSISTNGGVSFNNKDHTALGGSSDATYRVYLAGSTLYVVSNGSFSFSTNGGTSFTARNFSFYSRGDSFAVKAGTPNTLYLSGSGGGEYGFLTSTDDGATFTKQSAETAVSILLDGTAIYVTTYGSLRKSADEGVTFATVNVTDEWGNSTTYAGLAGIYTSGGKMYMYSSGNYAYSGSGRGLYFGTIQDLPPQILSIKRGDYNNPTDAATVYFRVAFSDDIAPADDLLAVPPLYKADAADFKLTTTGITDASITDVTCSGNYCTVTVNTGTTNGTIRLDVPATAQITNVTGTLMSNIPFTTGEVYTIDHGSPPTVPILLTPNPSVLVDTLTPKLDWKDSVQVLAAADLGWHYEVNVYTANKSYDKTFTTADDADPLAGLARSEYTFTDPLTPNTTYYWKVRSFNNKNMASAWTAPRAFRTRMTTPVLTAPVEDAVLDTKRPTFTWDAVTGATTYTVQLWTPNTLGVNALALTGTAKAPATTFTPTADLQPDKVYTWRVMANGLNPSLYSEFRSFTTSTNPPSLPVYVAPAANLLVNSAADIKLDWTAGLVSEPTKPAAAGFEVEYSPNKDFSGGTLVDITDPLVTEHIITAGTLDPNKTYYWHIRAYDNENAAKQRSAWTVARTFRTRLLQPVLIEPDNATVLNSKRPEFKWGAVAGATSYTLQVFKAGRAVLTITVLAPNVVYTPTYDLLAETEYTWQVKANGYNQGDYSDPFTFTTSENPPAIPVLKLPRNKTYIAAADPVTLSWYASAAKLTAVPPIPAPGSYEVQYADNKDFTGATSASVDGATLEHQIAGGTLLPGRTYYWRVRAWSGAGGAGNHSAWSVMYSLNVKYAPPVLTVPANGATSVPIRPTFTWTAGGNGVWTSFTLLIGTNETLTSGRRAFVIPASMGTTYTIPPTAAALKANTQYYWRVYINGVYISTFSIDPAWGFRTQ